MIRHHYKKPIVAVHVSVAPIRDAEGNITACRGDKKKYGANKTEAFLNNWEYDPKPVEQLRIQLLTTGIHAQSAISNRHSLLNGQRWRLAQTAANADLPGRVGHHPLDRLMHVVRRIRE